MIVWVLLVAGFGSIVAETSAVRNLIGEPDYRQVRLHWETDEQHIPQKGYQVKYCELQTWGFQRCRLQAVTTPKINQIDDTTTGIKVFTTDIKGLRMATTYSFEIKEQGERDDRASENDKNENTIVIPTKGFSAKASQCLPHASEIEVSTGPYFGGRIAVEAADGERCAIDGEPNSPRDTYTLRINHTECGSQVNDTTVATFVIVQENLPILTHSTRRFLVLCSYQPETLTVRAGINLPNINHGRGHAHVQNYEENNVNRIGRRGRMGRLLQKPQALVKEEIEEVPNQRSNAVPIIVIAMLSIAGIIGIVAVVLKIANKRIQKEFDNVSITSEISTTSSCSSVEESPSSTIP